MDSEQYDRTPGSSKVYAQTDLLNLQLNKLGNLERICETGNISIWDSPVYCNHGDRQRTSSTAHEREKERKILWLDYACFITFILKHRKYIALQKSRC